MRIRKQTGLIKIISSGLKIMPYFTYKYIFIRFILYFSLYIAFCLPHNFDYVAGIFFALSYSNCSKNDITCLWKNSFYSFILGKGINFFKKGNILPICGGVELK